MKISLLSLILLFNIQLHAQQTQPTVRIAFGSCSRHGVEDQLWPEVVNTHPDIWIWGGDNIYGDTSNMNALQNMYNQQKQRASYQQLLQTCPVTGTWDDHDYGTNDGGKYFVQRAESKKVAAEFLGLPKNNEIWKHEGIYNSTQVKKGKLTVSILNLDTRYFRDTIVKEHYTDEVTGKRLYRYRTNETGDVLGEAQWQWLEHELAHTKASLFIINSSIQLVAEEHRFEKWRNLPTALNRFYELLQRYPDKKVIIISGDRHMAELSRRTLPSLHYPLYDFTSSGLTHTWSNPWEEPNQYRVGQLIIQKNFGLIDITQRGKTLEVTFTVVGKQGIEYQRYKTEL